MARKTSIEAYRQIQENGLLPKRQWEVYDYIYKNGPCTQKDAIEGMAKKGVDTGAYTTRFSELRERGAIAEVGSRINHGSKFRAILWDVTDKLPKKLKRKNRTKCYFCNGKGYTED